MEDGTTPENDECVSLPGVPVWDMPLRESDTEGKEMYGI